MNIASLVWYKVLPAKFGGQKAIVQLSEAIAKHESYEMICSADNEPGIRFITKRILPAGKKQLIHPMIWKRIEKELIKEETRYLIVEHCYYALFGWWMKKKHNIRFIIHHHNIEADRFREMKKTGWPLLLQYEKWASRKADLNIYLTEEDRNQAIKRFGIAKENTIVIPYFISKQAPHYTKQNAAAILCKQYGIEEDKKLLVFNGTLDYEPNALAVKCIYDILAPMLQQANIPVHIFINGRNKFAEYQYLNHYSSPIVTMTGEVEDIELYFNAADVFINPVQTGGGVQTKTLEALARNINTIAFDHMCAGIPADISGNKLIRVADADWDGFVNAIIQALNEKNEIPEAFYAYYNEERLVSKLLAAMKNS